jgi:acyl-CoA synthetase (AMP-forming)/AMP-acid ligase II
MITHGQVYWGAMTRVADFNLTPHDVNLTVGPLYHVGALDTNATPTLFIGGTVVVHMNFRPASVMQAIHDEGVTNCWMAPSMVNMVFQLSDLADYDTSSLRILVLGGEKMPRPLLERVLNEWPSVGVYDGYGLTEAQGLVTILPAEHAVAKLGSVGWAGRGREIRLVDDQGHDVLDGEPGELIIRGPLVFPGYFDDKEATRTALRAGWLHTGDVAVRDSDGFYFIVDRKKDMIRSGGENIAASEVERVIYELPEVGEAAVVAMPHEKWMEVPVAFLVPKEGQRIDRQAVIDHCTKQLAKFKVPQDIRVVEALPRTPSGKVMKKDLRALFDADGSADADAPRRA